MKKTLLLIGLLLTCAIYGAAQEKGVDTQNSGIRDAGSGRGPATNGSKQDTGAGRGVNFGKGRTPDALDVPNPFRMTARRETVLEATTNYLRERGIVIDQDVSRLNEGIIVTQSFVFAKGTVITKAELEHYTEAPSSYGRGWTRARYTLTIEVQPIDGTTVKLSVNAKIEGRSDGPTGAEWVTLRSTGQAEQEIIGKIVENITGTAPSEPPAKPDSMFSLLLRPATDGRSRVSAVGVRYVF